MSVREEHLVKEEYYQKFISDMHQQASVYEKQAMKMFIDNDLHKGHCAMDNARALRAAANIMDNTACDGC